MFRVAAIIFIVCVITACYHEGENSLSLGQLSSVDFSQQEVIALGQTVAAAYVQFDGAKYVANPTFPEKFVKGYTPIANIVAHDNKREKRDEFYGYVSWQAGKTKSLVISIRGTSDFHEWVADAKFFKTPYNDNPSYGEVELGFHEVFSSFKVTTPNTTATTDIDEFLKGLESVKQGELDTITVVGHSLGSSLATLLAFDLATKGYAKNTDLLTFASPLTGNEAFVTAFTKNLKNSARIVNRPDLVTRVPPEILKFEHVQHEVEINSHDFDHIKRNILCYHSIQTYLHILSKREVALDPKCQVSAT